MIKQLNIIIAKYMRGASIFDACNAVGMPIDDFKKCLFFKEYHHEYSVQRKYFLGAQKIFILDYYNKVIKLADNLEHHVVWTKREEQIIHPEKEKEFRDLMLALKWYKEHVRILRQMYDAFDRGEDFKLAGMHYEIPDEVLEEKPINRSKQKASEYFLSKGEPSVFTEPWPLERVTSTVVRSFLLKCEAEILLGTPLLCGRTKLSKKEEEQEEKQDRRITKFPPEHIELRDRNYKFRFIKHELSEVVCSAAEEEIPEELEEEKPVAEESSIPIKTAEEKTEHEQILDAIIKVLPNKEYG